jgi:hypothetical protein
MSHKHNHATYQIWIFRNNTRYQNRLFKDRHIRKLVTQHFRPINYLDKNRGILAPIP